MPILQKVFLFFQSWHMATSFRIWVLMINLNQTARERYTMGTLAVFVNMKVLVDLNV